MGKTEGAARSRPRAFQTPNWLPRALVSSVALACAGLAAGCSLPFRALPLDNDRPAHARPFRQAQDGVVLAAELMSDEAECRAFFHETLIRDRIVPVVVHVENVEERTVVLRRERFALQLEGEPDAVSPIAPTAVVSRYRRGLGLGYLGLPLVAPYLRLRQEIARFNFELERDFRAKGFPNYLRVEPGDPPTAHVLFFDVSEQALTKLARSPVLEVHAEIEGEDGRLGKDVRFRLSLE